MKLVSREVEDILNEYNLYTHQVQAWNESFFRVLVDNDHIYTFQSTPVGEFMNYTVVAWWY